jgi:peptidylprolyl isomerase
MVPRQYQLAQIFVALSANSPHAAEDEAQRKLRDIRQQIAKPKADFAAIARRMSDDRSTAEKGGEVGWLREDALAQPIRDAVAGLPDSATSEPVRMPDGWHVLRLLATKAAAPSALADVRDQLVRALRQQRVAQSERALIDDLLRRQPVQLNEIQLQNLIAAKPSSP